MLGQTELPVCTDQGQASLQSLRTERPNYQAERPVGRDEGQAKQRGLISQNHFRGELDMVFFQGHIWLFSYQWESANLSPIM